jgi:hypothetical protein
MFKSATPCAGLPPLGEASGFGESWRTDLTLTGESFSPDR